MAKLYFRYSAMNAGKTTQLIQINHNYRERGMKTIIMKPGIDTKGNDKIVSRLGIDLSVDIIYSSNDNLYEKVKGKIDGINCVLVDEVQFSTSEQIDQLLKITVDFDIPVICFGLRTDFQMKGFPGSTRLLEIAHSIEELKTICSCGRKAIFNVRKINGIPSFDGEQVCIDNDAKVEYEAVCAKCYNKYKRLSE